MHVEDLRELQNVRNMLVSMRAFLVTCRTAKFVGATGPLFVGAIVPLFVDLTISLCWCAIVGGVIFAAVTMLIWSPLSFIFLFLVGGVV